MDITQTLPRSVISHWEHKKGRFTLFRSLLTLVLISQPFLISLLTDHVGRSRVVAWIISGGIMVFILLILTFVEYLFFSNKKVSKFSNYYASYVEEFLLWTSIITMIACVHPYHRAGIRALLSNQIAQEGCATCLTDSISAGLMDIGRSYFEEIFATILSIATIWCISPSMVFLYSTKFALMKLAVMWGICAGFIFAASTIMWTVYCSGMDVCYGNVAVAAWALLWVPIGRSLNHLPPFLNLAGKEVLKNYPDRSNW